MTQIVFKALYQPMLTIGVPTPLLVGEIFVCLIAFMAGTMGLLCIPVCVILHICMAKLLKADPHMLKILFDMVFMPEHKE